MRRDARRELRTTNVRVDGARLIRESDDPALLAKEPLARRVLGLGSSLASGEQHSALHPVQVARVGLLRELVHQIESALPVRSAIRTDARQVVSQPHPLILGNAAKPVAYVGTRVLRARKLLERDNATAQQQLRQLLRLEPPQELQRRLLHVGLGDASV